MDPAPSLPAPAPPPAALRAEARPPAEQVRGGFATALARALPQAAPAEAGTGGPAAPAGISSARAGRPGSPPAEGAGAAEPDDPPSAWPADPPSQPGLPALPPSVPDGLPPPVPPPGGEALSVQCTGSLGAAPAGSAAPMSDGLPVPAALGLESIARASVDLGSGSPRPGSVAAPALQGMARQGDLPDAAAPDPAAPAAATVPAVSGAACAAFGGWQVGDGLPVAARTGATAPAPSPDGQGALPSRQAPAMPASAAAGAAPGLPAPAPASMVPPATGHGASGPTGFEPAADPGTSPGMPPDRAIGGAEAAKPLPTGDAAVPADPMGEGAVTHPDAPATPRQPGSEAVPSHAVPVVAIAESVGAGGQPMAPIPAEASAPRPAPPPIRQLAPVAIALALGPGQAPSLMLALEPEALGRVEIRIERAAEGEAAAIRVLAERPETLALLQRDAQALDRALGQAGLTVAEGGLRFDLAGDDRAGGEQPGARHEAGRHRPPPPEARPPTRPRAAALSLLDIAV